MNTENVRWSCSAQLDLLGFSNHLQVANWDIRTETGRQAVARLSSLEDAIMLLEKEKDIHPQLYPRNLECVRFNDALFLGMDAEHLSPPNRQTTLTGGYAMNQLRALHPEEGKTTLEGTTAESGGQEHEGTLTASFGPWTICEAHCSRHCEEIPYLQASEFNRSNQSSALRGLSEDKHIGEMANNGIVSDTKGRTAEAQRWRDREADACTI